MGFKDKIMIGWRHLAIFLGFGIVSTAYIIHPNQPASFVQETQVPPSHRICLVGDTGENNEGQKRVASLIAENCDRVFILGDIIYPIGIRSENDPRLRTHFLDHYEKLGIPFHLILGNHGYYSKVDPVGVWKRVGKIHNWVRFPHAFYLQKIGNLCFFAVDSTPITSAKATIRFQTQEEWLEKAVQTKGCKKKYLLSHHPWKSPGRHGDAKGRMKKFFDKFEKYFDLLIAGHDHLLARDGKSIVSGAGAKLRTKLTRETADFLAISLGIYRIVDGEGEFILAPSTDQ